jgi:hypothetical protein
MKITNINKFLYFFFSLSIFVGLFTGEDSSGSGGFALDFKSTFPLIENPFHPEIFGGIDMKFPVHYYIGSIIYLLVKNDFYLRFFYSAISLICPYIFYCCLKKKYLKIDLNILFLFSLVIFMFPTFRSSAIWANTQITAIIFFLISLYYFTMWDGKKCINLNLIFMLFFMALAVYTRQEYSLPYLYFVYYFYRELKFEQFIKTCMIIFLLGVPGIILVYLKPALIPLYLNIDIFDSLLVNLSILSFYLIPVFIIIYSFNEKAKYINIKYCIIGLFISLIVVGICAINFNYNFKMGGGFFIKASIILFKNLYFFYFTSFLGLFFIYLLSLENRNNLILSLILIFGFSSYVIFQKYFEPMFFLLFFLVYKTELTKKILFKKTNVILFQFYFFAYLGAALLNDYFVITKNL